MTKALRAVAYDAKLAALRPDALAEDGSANLPTLLAAILTELRQDVVTLGRADRLSDA